MMDVRGEILVTGGLGYIGSHVIVALSEIGYRSIVIDNLENSSIETLDALEALCGQEPVFYFGDVRDRGLLRSVLRRHDIECCVHMAGLKAVADSVSNPLEYYDANVAGAVALLQALQERDCFRIVFSSSATVYGDPQTLPIPETHPIAPVNPYGRSKAIVEQIMQDLCGSDARWSACCLRYFNPAGAHPSGLIGERPNGVPNNLMPYVAQVAGGRRDKLRIFGKDYPTRDGTGVRDYIHVVDLAEAHARAVGRTARNTGWEAINLGSGSGYTVLEIVEAYRAASGSPIPHEFVARRPGDIASCYADVASAHRTLDWRPTRDVVEICKDAYRFETQAVREVNIPNTTMDAANAEPPARFRATGT
jgi:UDP-glucose 4-epimerase